MTSGKTSRWIRKQTFEKIKGKTPLGLSPPLKFHDTITSLTKSYSKGITNHIDIFVKKPMIWTYPMPFSIHSVSFKSLVFNSVLQENNKTINHLFVEWIVNRYNFTFIDTRTFPINNKTRPIRKIPPITPREIARIGAGAGQATKIQKFT